jgi:hypothetical protein
MIGMPPNTASAARVLFFLLLSFSVLAPGPLARQQPQPAVSGQGEEVVRISAELVQTDVTVFDKQGPFRRRLAARAVRVPR